MVTNDVAATVLKAGHHGSNTSSSAKFISNVKSKVGIISYGKNNNYDHPHAAIPARLKNVVAKVYETAKHCNIIVKTDGVKYSVTTDCKKTIATPAPVKTTKPIPKPVPKKVTTPAKVQSGFKNCTELRKVYPGGVRV